MPKRLKTLARIISDAGLDYTAVVEPSFCNTDRFIKGKVWRVPGKGRHGNKLTVKNNLGEVIFTHDAAQTYRSNYEVERWMKNQGIKSGD